VNKKELLTSAIARKPVRQIPTMEIVFELEQELTGRAYTLGKALSALRGKERWRALDSNIDIYVECARRLGYASITVHPTPTPWYVPGENYYPTLEDELYVIRGICERAGDEIFVAAGIDGTYAIPEGCDMESFIWRLADEPEAVKAQAKKNVEWAVEQMQRLIEAGAQIMYCCSDYCFNQGPFLSPAMFEEFIYPYLKWQTAQLQSAGAYVIKHTDGNILPLLDMLVDTGPDVIHSIDPVAGLDIGEVKRRIDGRVCIMGNVDSTKLQCGTRDEVIASCRKALAGGQGGGYIYSTCNSVFKGIPLDHYMVMLDELKKHNGVCHE